MMRYAIWITGPMMVLTLGLISATPSRAVCDAPEHRQFDFWLGDWEVNKHQADQRERRNIITSEHDGCVIHEQYTAGKYAGTSLNFYDKVSGKWHQTWIDNQGKPLFLSGGLEDGKMVLSSDRQVMPIQRVTWTPNEDGTVRQHWQSSDDGKTWKDVFDGLYTPYAKDSQPQKD